MKSKTVLKPVPPITADNAEAPAKAKPDPFAKIKTRGPAPQAAPELSLGLPAFPTKEEPIAGLQKVSFADYWRDPGVNRSLLEKIMMSPAHLKHYQEHGAEETSALRQGRLLHLLVLEPYTAADQIAVFTGATRRGNAWDAFELANADKLIVTQSELDAAKSQRDALFANPLVRGALARCMREATAFWSCEVTGVACKARPDLVVYRGGFDGGLVYDVKTTHDLSTESFTRDAYKFGYHRQAAWYLEGATQATGKMFNRFIIIAVEKSAPHAVRVFEMSRNMIERGQQENATNIALYAECVRSGQWPGFAPVIETLDVPRWTL